MSAFTETSTAQMIGGKESEVKIGSKTQKAPITPIVQRFVSLRDEKEHPALVCYDQDYKLNKSYTWAEYVNSAFGFAKFLTNNSSGNVALHSFNCPEWFIASMGSMIANRIFTGIYNTNNTEQCMHVVNTGKCDVLVIESYSLLLEKYSSVFTDLTSRGVKVVVINNDREKVVKAESIALLDSFPTVLWSSLSVHAYTPDHEFERILEKVDVDAPCTLIFTSGTIKNPKAVQLSHRNIDAAVAGVLSRFKLVDYEERFVSYLPLSHIAGQAIDLYAPIFCKGSVHFARPDALKGTIKNTLLSVRPTIFFGVPRVWEKFREGLTAVSEKTYSNGWAGWALGKFMSAIKCVEREYNTSDNYYYQSGLYPLTVVSTRVVSKIKEKLGLDKCRYFATGAAPISKDVLEYFSSIGICILELYGMSETCGVISVSDHVHSVRGSCGSAVPGVTIKIGANDEILVKGDNVFSGYYNSTESNDIDADGFLHTGDCGKIDPDGFLSITGRIKELLITAGGENIPPVRIEDFVKAKIPGEIQVLLVGDKKKFLSMLVFVPPASDGSSAITEEVKRVVKGAIDFYNRSPDGAISNSQKINNFTFVDGHPTIENGLLTPTMKYKRSKIVEVYKKEIDAMYPADA
ncbi:hypothetical protein YASMINEVIRUS_1487 [Yasminevirus sp. GU-2018]|uniref:AMP-dependent synthetase/ligase domain-containing protein n=1 Tax=Yasminevirus sp. GU-2018 TaxID=2420051 RepID=A0A5K0UB61_9VIRU|nr:hypothetical protein YASMINEVIRUS_1487 [Yasminevirus sp. GU-2018]